MTGPPASSPLAEASTSKGAAPRRIGRYVVLGQIGAGSMGVILAAYDPELRRELAIKVIRAGRRSERERARLLREAQAMARINHPNVVSVFDVGTVDADVFIAMELVEGTTLSAWLEEGARPWREVLRRFVAAGRGLAAAHEAGLVHRDFKPENVLVSARGEVKVTDFGLARDDGREGARVNEPGAAREPASPAIDPALTRDGAMTGTPAYMAPEQFLSRRVDARSDQFSFCVALHEGLTGRRPFTGASVVELMENVVGGRRAAGGRRAGIPARVLAALDRGLATDAAARWPNMPALLDALDLRPGRGRRATLAVVGVVAACGLAYGGVEARARYQDSVCRAAGEAVYERWSEDARGRVRGALLATGAHHAAETWTRLEQRVVRWSAAWSGARVEACVAARGDSEFARLRGRCLEDQLGELASLIEVLAEADESVAKKAISAAAQLPQVESCSSLPWLMAEVRPEEQGGAAERLAEPRARLARARALISAGRYDDALELINHALEQARAADQPAPTLEVEALLELGHAQQKRSEYAAAETALTDAYFRAGALSHDRVSADAAARLVFLVGDLLARPDEGLAWRRHADMLIARLGQQGLALDSAVEFGLGALYRQKGDHETSLEHYQRALEIRERLYGPDGLNCAGVLLSIGVAHYVAGRYEASRDAQRRAIEIMVAALGPEHPNLAYSYTALGAASDGLGDIQGAEEAFRRALEIRQQTFGEDHLQVGEALGNLGSLLFVQGELAEALTLLERSQEIRERRLGPDHPSVATNLLNMGLLLTERGEHERALAALRRSLTIREQALGPEHPAVATGLEGVGASLRRQGALDEAAPLLERALALREKTVGADHPDQAHALTLLGSIARERGAPERALELLQRALALRVKGNGPEHHRVAEVWLELGRALQALERYDEAQAEFERALERWESAFGPTHIRIAEATAALGLLHLERGQPARAREHLERAVSLLEGSELDPRRLADARAALARADQDGSGINSATRRQ